MNLPRKCKVLFITILMCFYSSAFANSINMCLTGKIEKMLPLYMDDFMNAVDLSVKESDVGENIDVKTYFYDNEPLAPIAAYKKMKDDGCTAIIGFEYLSDLMLVDKIERDENIPIFTSYASSMDSDDIKKNIFIFNPTYDYQARKMLEFLESHFQSVKNVLLVTEVSRIELEKYKLAYGKLLNKKDIKYDAFDFLENDPNLGEKLKRFLKQKNKTYDYVFVFSGAVGSSKIVNMMNNHKTIFIGTENFGSSSDQSLFIRLQDKKVRAFFIRNIDFIKADEKLKKFEADYYAHYHSEPNTLSAYTYDGANMIIVAFKENGNARTSDVLNTNYTGVTGAYIKNGKFHRSKNYVILSVGKNGYE